MVIMQNLVRISGIFLTSVSECIDFNRILFSKFLSRLTIFLGFFDRLDTENDLNVYSHKSKFYEKKI